MPLDGPQLDGLIVGSGDESVVYRRELDAVDGQGVATYLIFFLFVVFAKYHLICLYGKDIALFRYYNTIVK